jgi:ActR/RegA family two-component response regulator
MAAATSAGWDAEGCDDAMGAQRQTLLEPRQMVVVDLEAAGGTAPEPLKKLCERLARQKDLLLVLCGNASNALEEIWARQLGAWLYLPGVVDDSDLSSLFEEAGQIARRRQSLSRQQAHFPPSSAATA